MSPTDLEDSYLDGLSPQQQQRLALALDEYFECLEAGRPPTREQFVAQHPDLAAPLGSYLESLEFLQHAAAGFVPSQAAADGALPEIDDFQILREIGRGGMGVVYEARQVSLDRRVALKVLPFSSLLDSRQIARFRNEAHAAAQLTHAHIVPVYAVGDHRGMHYYAMQLIDGPTLDDVGRWLARPSTDASTEPAGTAPAISGALAVERSARPRRSGAGAGGNTGGSAEAGAQAPDAQTHALASAATQGRAPFHKPRIPLPVQTWRRRDAGFIRAAAQLGIQAAEALQAAHELGIVHRDIKPSNLLLDQEGQVWVTDFGLARRHTDVDLTRSGDLVGTMRYMSPEQAQGSHFTDPRSDIYSLGATLYELLAGKPAVRGDSPAAILREMDRSQPYRLKLWNAAAPADLENIVHKAMSKAPSDRYATAHALAEDLQRFLDGKATVARRPTIAERATRWAWRHKQAVVGAFAALVLAVAGLLAGVLLLAQERSRTEAALGASRESFQQYRRQLAVTHAQLAVLQEQNGARGAAAASFEKAVGLQRAIWDESPQDLEALESLAGTMSNQSVFLARGAPELAESSFKSTIELQTRLMTQSEESPEAAERRRQLALTWSNYGSFLQGQGRTDAAVEAFDNALKLLTPLANRHPQAAADLAVCSNNLGMSWMALGKLDAAAASFQDALTWLLPRVDYESATPGELSSLGGVYNNLGMLQEKGGRREEAAESFREAIKHQSRAVQMAPRVNRFREFLEKHHNNLERVRQGNGGSRPASP